VAILVLSFPHNKSTQSSDVQVLKQLLSPEITNGGRVTWWPYFKKFKIDICKFQKIQNQKLGVDNVELYQLAKTRFKIILGCTKITI
jgi:hypothetical protein